MSHPAVLLDRDGTLNESPDGWVTEVADFVPIPGAFEAVARLCRAGWPVAIATNQSCVGRGLATMEQIDRVHAECARLAAEHGAAFDGIFVCPHAPDEGCACRKPLPGLLLEAAHRREYDLFRSYYIGDSERDLVAGRTAGATALLVLTGHARESRPDHPEDLTFPTVAEAIDWILSRPEGGRRA